MGITNIQWCARHTVHPTGKCPHGATGEERCLDVECERCWVKGYSANLWIGCTPVSEACRNCWAEGVSLRMGLDVWGRRADRRLTGDAVFASVAAWNKKAEKTGQRRGVFWEDMGDLFEDRPEFEERRVRAFAAMEAAPGLDHMLLTKRPENVLLMVPPYWINGEGWPSQVWMGATVEDGQTAFERTHHIVEWSAHGATTFISAEPLLGNLLAAGPLVGVDLMIIGGESGPGARPFDLGAAEALVRDASDAGAAVFMKQMGSRWASATGRGLLRKGASHGQDPYRWPEWARRRELPVVGGGQ
jgi:protein gp37